MHAYLILVHDDLYVLEKQLKLIDDKRNHIYIHIDAKKKFDKNFFKRVVKESQVFILEDRVFCYWADSSLIEAEMKLLKKANKKKYMYYHLMSEACLPIKTQDYIHNFFEKNSGKEFIQFDNINYKFAEYKMNYYHFFLKNNYYRKNIFIKGLRYFFVELQKKLKIKRKNNYKLKHGSQWFSLTNGAVEKILIKDKEIKKIIKKTLACDEVIFQTILYNSDIKNYFYKFEESMKGNMRLIDFTRGNPYIFREKDFKEILESEYLFCRKFSSKVDKRIIDKIYVELNKKRCKRKE